MVLYTKNVSEPWFSLIKIGAKKCEGRLNMNDFSNMKKGDIIAFTNNTLGFNRTFTCKITSVHNYDSFFDYLENETISKCLPGIDTIEEGVNVYYQYYSPENERKYGIRAIRLRVVS